MVMFLYRSVLVPMFSVVQVTMGPGRQARTGPRVWSWKEALCSTTMDGDNRARRPGLSSAHTGDGCVRCRPLNRILIAQRIAAPQMVISMVVALAHVAANHLLIHTAGLGFYGAAYAIGIASVNNTLLTAAWVYFSGMSGRVWGRPTWDAFKVDPLCDIILNSFCKEHCGSVLSCCLG